MTRDPVGKDYNQCSYDIADRHCRNVNVFSISYCKAKTLYRLEYSVAGSWILFWRE